MLAAVLNHDGQQQSATQTRRRALADTDHLALLHAIWTVETTPAREQHYRDLFMNTLPPGHRAEPGHQAQWLWRTLRAAELAGLDPAGVLADAIAERDLGPVPGPDVRGMPDGRLLHLRDTYPVETAWAPQYVGDELRQVRAAAWDARLAGLRAAAEARAVAQHCDHAAAQHKLAASYQALEQAYRAASR